MTRTERYVEQLRTPYLYLQVGRLDGAGWEHRNYHPVHSMRDILAILRTTITDVAYECDDLPVSITITLHPPLDALL